MRRHKQLGRKFVGLSFLVSFFKIFQCAIIIQKQGLYVAMKFYVAKLVGDCKPFFADMLDAAVDFDK